MVNLFNYQEGLLLKLFRWTQWGSGVREMRWTMGLKGEKVLAGDEIAREDFVLVSYKLNVSFSIPTIITLFYRTLT